MNTQTLPLVPFGKYKGQPITTLMNDTKYLEWCKQQEWFQKFPIVYNICVNQTITTSNQNSKTPEHNKLQNLFLNEPTQINLLNILFGSNIGVKFKQNFKLLILDEDFIKYFDSSTITLWSGNDTSLSSSFLNKTLNNNIIWFVPEFYRSLKKSKIVFEDKYNWDFILYYCDYQEIDFETKCDDDTKIIKTELLNNILKKYKFNLNRCETIRELDTHIFKLESNHRVCIDVVCNNIIICCELKPILSDDYPCVLRKMKTQIELTKNDKVFEGVSKIYILVIGSFTSTNTSKNQLITIFKQSNIRVVFTEEIFDNLQYQTITEQIQDITIHSTYQEKIEENNLLMEKLLQAEEKIQQLEEEILSLKTQKQGKSIKDFFGKK